LDDPDPDQVPGDLRDLEALEGQRLASVPGVEEDQAGCAADGLLAIILIHAIVQRDLAVHRDQLARAQIALVDVEDAQHAQILRAQILAPGGDRALDRCIDDIGRRLRAVAKQLVDARRNLIGRIIRRRAGQSRRGGGGEGEQGKAVLHLMLRELAPLN
jgi:hypothetical protein